VKIVVSQRTMLIDGVPACPRCGRRPRKPIPETATLTRRRGRRWYGYCAICGPDAERERRDRLAQERENLLALVEELRAIVPTGRHHASG
jgi:hypothetical protein